MLFGSKGCKCQFEQSADNFLIVVKVFAENELISHVPSFKKTEEEADNTVGKNIEVDE